MPGHYVDVGLPLPIHVLEVASYASWVLLIVLALGQALESKLLPVLIFLRRKLGCKYQPTNTTRRQLKRSLNASTIFSVLLAVAVAWASNLESAHFNAKAENASQDAVNASQQATNAESLAGQAQTNAKETLAAAEHDLGESADLRRQITISDDALTRLQKDHEKQEAEQIKQLNSWLSLLERYQLARTFDPAQHKRLVAVFSQYQDKRAMFVLASYDPEAWQFANNLSGLLVEAGWTITTKISLDPSLSGVAVISQGFARGQPPPKNVGGIAIGEDLNLEGIETVSIFNPSYKEDFPTIEIGSKPPLRIRHDTSQ